jgi:hypothetical protein
MAWHVFLDTGEAPAVVPILSVRFQLEQNAVFVTRQILSHGFEAYEDSPGVILSRPVQKWVSELVGAVEPASIERGTVEDELGTLVFLAVVGTSRLPITSLESPLPDFSLGRLAYLPGLSDVEEPWTDSLQFLSAALAGSRPLVEQAKSLETALRAAGHIPSTELAKVLKNSAHTADRGPAWTSGLLRAVFNGVALSPYTHFSDAMVGLIVELADSLWFGLAEATDAIGYMLRHLCRHLTAFDLTLFHNFGANYPDALFLESLLAAYVELIARDHELILDSHSACGRRRRALRQACLVRRHYEGHCVPDAPTSMGENIRVLPPPFARVPEEQILERGKRRRKLFVDHSTQDLLGEIGRRALDAGIADLDDPRELRELGMAQFLDRPVGVLKEPGEVDRTPLLAYEAFSRSIARRRLGELKSAGWIADARRDALLAALQELSVPGVPIADLSPRERPGVVSIADAAKAAADFVLVRTTRGSLDELMSQFDLRTLGDIPAEAHAWLTRDPAVLLVQHIAPGEPSRPVLRAYCRGELRLELALK